MDTSEEDDKLVSRILQLSLAHFPNDGNSGFHSPTSRSPVKCYGRKKQFLVFHIAPLPYWDCRRPKDLIPLLPELKARFISTISPGVEYSGVHLHFVRSSPSDRVQLG